MAAYITASILSYYHVDKHYARVIAWICILALSFSSTGIYSGYIYTSEIKKHSILNNIGFIGCILIFLFINIMGILAAFNFPF
jgi:TM2 domain-containing membrane protein YozV